MMTLVEVKKMKRSSIITDLSLRTTPHRALLKALGLSNQDFSKPLVAVVNSWNEIVPGHMHLKDLACAVKQGIWESGGVPLEFNTIAICDGIAMGHPGMRYPLVSRELIADSIEAMLEAHCFDAACYIASCDKIVPAMLMAAVRCNIPGIMVTGGPMQHFDSNGEHYTYSYTWQVDQMFREGKISPEERQYFEDHLCPGAGACAGLFTANTMQILAESMGFVLSGTATIPAVDAAKISAARRAGNQLMELFQNEITPRDIITEKALENALTTLMATGGSTNAALHLPAIAREMDISLDLGIFNDFSDKTPLLVKINPSSSVSIPDFHADGGVPVILKELLISGKIHGDVLTVNGEPLEKILENIPPSSEVRRQYIRPCSNPYSPHGGLVVLKGTLAPAGSILKLSAIKTTKLFFEGTARVFDSEETAVNAILSDDLGDVTILIIRYEGPKGGPGMREMLAATEALCNANLDENVVLITDGRFSGVTRGPCIGHVSPEAAECGPIALVENGDLLQIDIEHRLMNFVDLTPDQLQQRESQFQFPLSYQEKIKNLKGILKQYIKSVQSASGGAVRD